MNTLVHKGFIYFLLYTVVASIFYYLVPPVYPPELLEIIFPVILAVQVIVILEFEKRSGLKKLEWTGFRKNADFFALFLIIFASRLIFLNHFSVWLDEDQQAHTAVTRFPIVAGLLQHQPPLDIIFMKLGVLVSKYSVWGLRIHAALFSALAGSYFYLLVKKVSKSALVSLIITVFFCFHTYSVQYGYEARPISLGLFLEILFISYVLSIFSDESELKNRIWILTSLTFLYLCSLGMQPVFVVGATMTFLFFACFKNRSYIKSFLSILLGFICFLPIQLIILKYAPPRFTKTQGFNLERFFDQFEIQNFQFLKIYLFPWVFIIFALLALNFLFILARKKKIITYLPVSYIGFVIAFMCLTLIPYFLAHIQWPLMHYYLVSILPLVLLMVAFLWSYLVKENFLKPAAAQIVFVSLSFVAVFFHSWPTQENLPKRDDFKGAYNFLKENSRSSDAVFSICFIASGYCPHSLTGVSFYRFEDGANAIDPVNLFKANVLIYEEFLKTRKPTENIFFVNYSKQSNFYFAPELDITAGRFQGLQIIKIVNKNNDIAGSVVQFLKPYIEQAEKNNMIYVQALEYSIISYEHKADINSIKKYLTLYKRLHPGSKDTSYLLDQRMILYGI